MWATRWTKRVAVDVGADHSRCPPFLVAHVAVFSAIVTLAMKKETRVCEGGGGGGGKLVPTRAR